MSETEGLSPYQGKGWQPRKGGLRDDLKEGGGIWASMRVDSEYKELKAVLLHAPGKELLAIRSPNQAQHLEKIDPGAIRREFDAYASALAKQGVSVHFVEPQGKRFPWSAPKHNLMYVRDLFVMTKAGAVVSRMASRVRAGEEKFAALALAEMGIPIAATIGGRGLFEGADALWLDNRTVICGVGNRTNLGGFKQLASVLALQEVDCLPVPLPSGIQHLLGIVQIVDRKTALLRTGLASTKLVRILQERGYRIVAIPESEEVRRKQGMNLVTIAPRTVIMAAGCPALQSALRESRIGVAAEIAISELIKGAGGLGCATGVLARR